MYRALRRTAFLFLVAAWPVAAKADPLVFILMSVAKEIASSAIEKAWVRQAALSALPPAPAVTYPGTTVEPATLKRIIDDSFVYLSSSQRNEVFESLNEMLLDPKTAGNRAALIEFFLHKALAVRAALIELGKLSYEQKEGLARQFREETDLLPEEERRQLQILLEQQLLPVPSDLNRLLLSQLQEPRKQQ